MVVRLPFNRETAHSLLGYTPAFPNFKERPGNVCWVFISKVVLYLFGDYMEKVGYMVELQDGIFDDIKRVPEWDSSSVDPDAVLEQICSRARGAMSVLSEAELNQCCERFFQEVVQLCCRGVALVSFLGREVACRRTLGHRGLIDFLIGVAGECYVLEVKYAAPKTLVIPPGIDRLKMSVAELLMLRFTNARDFNAGKTVDEHCMKVAIAQAQQSYDRYFANVIPATSRRIAWVAIGQQIVSSGVYEAIPEPTLFSMAADFAAGKYD
jgi:hypothetical protein